MHPSKTCSKKLKSQFPLVSFERNLPWLSLLSIDDAMPKNTAAASKKFNTRRRYVSEIQNALLSALYCGEIILLRKLDFNSEMRLLSPAASAGAVIHTLEKIFQWKQCILNSTNLYFFHYERCNRPGKFFNRFWSQTPPLGLTQNLKHTIFLGPRTVLPGAGGTWNCLHKPACTFAQNFACLNLPFYYRIWRAVTGDNNAFHSFCNLLDYCFYCSAAAWNDPFYHMHKKPHIYKKTACSVFREGSNSYIPEVFASVSYPTFTLFLNWKQKWPKCVQALLSIHVIFCSECCWFSCDFNFSWTMWFDFQWSRLCLHKCVTWHPC